MRSQSFIPCRAWLAVFCAAWCWAAPALALTLSIGNTNSVPGGTALIPVSVAGAPTNISAFCLFLTNNAGFPLPSVTAGPAQPGLVAFVDDFGNGVYRVTGFVTNDPPIGNGIVANLSYPIPSSTPPSTYPLALPSSLPADAPPGPNPEARSLITSALIPSTSTNGFIIVSVVSQPYLTSLQRLGNGTFQFAFTNASGANFSVLATTNLATPFSSWTYVGAAAQVSGGLYQFDDPFATNYPQRFYTVRSP